ncbi:MAG TPA: lysylphosphatidylglycerol synthase transmembrane domain-containing protein [Casimicrobiaceae bacterium]|nr:lysylphosphatidylglycerol synthase transmembrane domain-containing protein [Casimicrobiaceae bacterium]
MPTAISPTRPWRERHAWIAFGIAVVLLAAVAWGVQRFVGWDTVATTATQIPSADWLAFTAFLLLSYLARALRLWRLLHDVEPRTRMTRATLVFLVHNALSSFMPARLGEATMPLLARRWLGVDWAATIGALAWWRTSDLAVLAAVALALIATGATVLAPLYALALAACAVPVIVVLLRGAVLRFVDAQARRAAGDPAWARLTRRVLAGMPARLRAVLADLALAVLSWTTKLAGFAILMQAALRAIGDNVPPLPLLAAAGLAGDAGGALPLPTLGGVGPFEAGIVLGLGALGIDPRPALAIGVTLHGALLLSIAASGLAALAIGVWLTRRSHR